MRELGDEASVPFELGKLMPQDLPSADEVLLSSTAGGIMPVGYVNNRALGMGCPVVLSRQLRDRYWECHDEDWHGTPVDYADTNSVSATSGESIQASVSHIPCLRPSIK